MKKSKRGRPVGSKNKIKRKKRNLVNSQFSYTPMQSWYEVHNSDIKEHAKMLNRYELIDFIRNKLLPYLEGK